MQDRMANKVKSQDTTKKRTQQSPSPPLPRPLYPYFIRSHPHSLASLRTRAANDQLSCRLTASLLLSSETRSLPVFHFYRCIMNQLRVDMNTVIGPSWKSKIMIINAAVFVHDFIPRHKSHKSTSHSARFHCTNTDPEVDIQPASLK